MSTVNDPVNNPSHYTSHPSGVEAIEITRHMSYNLGNVVKYVWRADLKLERVQDLEKAQFYLADEIAKLKLIEEQKRLDDKAMEEGYAILRTQTDREMQQGKHTARWTEQDEQEHLLRRAEQDDAAYESQMEDLDAQTAADEADQKWEASLAEERASGKARSATPGGWTEKDEQERQLRCLTADQLSLMTKDEAIALALYRARLIRGDEPELTRDIRRLNACL